MYWKNSQMASCKVIGQKRPSRFTHSYSLSEKRDCESELPAVSNCADAQYKLGMAKMHAGDFQGALDSLRNAKGNYAKAEKLSDSHEFVMIEVKEQAQTDLWSAVALFQLGKIAEATP
jgi:hypothetical protein